MGEQLWELLSGIPDYWRVFLLSTLPITELRAAIPLGVAWGMQPWHCFLWAVTGNFAPVIPLLLLINPLYRLLCGIKPLRSRIMKFMEKTRKKGRQAEKYGAMGLVLFVAVPLPGTGIWTGCLIAFLLGIRLIPAVLAITLGEILAGVMVTLASVGVMNLIREMNALKFVIMAVVLVIILWWIYYKRKKINKI